MSILRVTRACGFFGRARGLIARPPLPAGEGLLLSSCRSVHTAFMRHPIDVLFLDPHGRVLEVRAHVLPWRAVACWRAHSALELRAGGATEAALHAGASVQIEAHAVKGGVARRSNAQKGAALVEFVIVIPLVLFVMLGVMQAALAFHAKSALNYAVFSAARAGSMDHARPASIFTALARGMVPYYGGGSTLPELGRSFAAARADFAKGAARLEILSPTARSFDDFHSPGLQAAAGGARVIPWLDIIRLRCPRDRPSCAWNYATNASGQSLQDANLLAVRVTYGIPPAKQMPMVGAFYTFALRHLGVGSDDAFVEDLLHNGRIPVVARTTIRMMSDAYEAGRVSYSGTLTHAPANPIDGALPACPNWNPNCDGHAANGGGSTQCNPQTDPNCLPKGCRRGDAACDPSCGVRMCCTAS